MKRQLLVGTALGVLMAFAPAGASTRTVLTPEGQQGSPAMMLLAQDEAAPVEELLPKKQRKKGGGEQAAPEQQAAPEPQPEAKPAQQAEEAKPRKQRKPVVEEAAPAQPEAEPAQHAEEAKPKKRRKPVVEEAAPAQPEAEPAQQAEQAKPKKRRKPVVEEAAPAQPEAEPAQQAEEAKPKKQRKPVVEEAAPAQPEAEPAQQAEEAKPRKQRKPVVEEAAPAQPEAEPAQQAEEAKPRKQRKPIVEEAKPEVQPNPPAQEEAPGTTTAEEPGAAKPKDKAGATEAEVPAATAGTEPTEPPAAGTVGAQPENAPPVFDSAKEAAPDEAGTGSVAAEPAKPAAPAAAPPADDQAAQAEVRQEKIETVTAEKGTRVAEAPPVVRLAETRPQGVDVLREIGDRVVIQFNNQIIVESSDRPRLTRDSREVYYEDLSGGRTRETVIRADGTRVVTVRNQYGDIVRRSRITEDDREYVLAYVDERDYERIGDWRDPGDELPPMRLDIPMEEYVLDADDVEDPDIYYAFLERPPVERVERLYSVDEVKRSARIRDKLPRIELDTITFEFGSATIEESQIPRLQGVAEAMERMLKKNPAESFLIEGHTDAVGSDVANLALSDQRAEAVAQALTNVFAIPPENLATQGYGERYLKVKTEEPEQLNRRVAMRRITPLVAPVASAQ